jgi:cell division protein YceG involved in septum cleavage
LERNRYHKSQRNILFTIKTYVYYQEYEGSGTYQGTRESVIEQFKKEMFDKYNFHEASPNKEHIVEEIIITSIVEKESTTVLKRR